MKIKVLKLNNPEGAILFWEEEDEKKVKHKRFKEVKSMETFDVFDKWGHQLIAKYPEYLQVVAYGEAVAYAAAKDEIPVAQKGK